MSETEPTDTILYESVSALDALASLLCAVDEKAGLTYVNPAGLANLVRAIHRRLAVGEEQVADEHQRLFRLEQAAHGRRFAEELEGDRK